MFKNKGLQVASSDLTVAARLLKSEPAVMRRRVRRISALGDDNQYAMALYTLAAGHRFTWTTEDWAAVLNKLDDCDITVEVWLKGIKT